MNTIRKLLKNKRLQEIFKFGINGGVSFLIDFGIMNLLIHGFGTDHLIASSIGFSISVIVNYIICKFWVFENAKNQSNRALFLFIGSSVIGLGLNTFFMWILVDCIGLFVNVSKAIATLLVMIWNYFAKRKAVYLNKTQ